MSTTIIYLSELSNEQRKALSKKHKIKPLSIATPEEHELMLQTDCTLRESRSFLHSCILYKQLLDKLMPSNIEYYMEKLSSEGLGGVVLEESAKYLAGILTEEQAHYFAFEVLQ